jgi:signal transduction histidine kinase
VKAILPRSLFGQMAIVMTAALLVASAVNFAILLSERSRYGLIESSGPAITRFVDQTLEIVASPPPTGKRTIILGRRRGPGSYAVSVENLVDSRAMPRNARLEQRLKRALTDADISIQTVRASTQKLVRPTRSHERFPEPAFPDQARGDPRDAYFDQGPFFQSAPPADVPAPARNARADGPPDNMMGPRVFRQIVLAAQIPDGRWFNAVIISPVPPNDEIFRLGASTFILFAFVLTAALWIASRVSRPLDDLARATARVGAAAEPEEVEVRGPSDIQQTLRAFNLMSRRVSQLLGEKDVMLGALGHDLRTPLASLRIRIESMEPEAERQKAVKTIEEAAQLLDDILDLARLGRSTEPVQMMDVSVLVQDMVEDYAETGAAVTLSDFVRVPVSCRPILFRRLLRNLIDNALAYGGSAQLQVRTAGDKAAISVLDEGPGMTDKALATATQPFVRADASRYRGTGGAGLGLALAEAIARIHGGELTLANRKPHGLSATITLPLASA